jgi:hypothetical protein
LAVWMSRFLVINLLKMKKILFLSLVALLTASCSNIFNSIVIPNQCKKCEVIDTYSQEVLFKNEGCGGSNVRLEEDAKVAAYNMSRNGSICNVEVRCETWRKAKTEN